MGIGDYFGPVDDFDQWLTTLVSWSHDNIPAIPDVTNALSTVVEETGLKWGVTPRHYFWYRPAVVHVVEFVLFHAFCALLYWFSRNYYKRNVAAAARRGQKSTDAGKYATKFGVLERIMGVVLVGCFLSQVLLKSIRPNAMIQIWWLIMPCHLITLAWSYILLATDEAMHMRHYQYLATLIATFHWGPAGAAAVPDWSDHQFRVEGMIFVVHHGLLVLLPFYFAAKYGFMPMSLEYFLHSTFIATIINVGPYTIASYLTGLNVNYHLYPPPKLLNFGFFRSRFYRFYMIAMLIALSIACRVIIGAVGWIVNVVVRAFGRVLGVGRRPPAAAADAKKQK